MYRPCCDNPILAGATLLILVAAFPAQRAHADETLGATQTTADQHQATVKKLVRQFCFDCHGADAHEGGVRLDKLHAAADAPDEASRAKLLEKVLRVLSSGKMPPEDAHRPSDQQRALLVSAVDARLNQLAENARRRGRHTRSRRLTVEEYNFTMQALFGVDAQFADMLPPDPLAATGYRNDRQRLGLSSLQIEAYLDSARRAVQRYVQFGGFDQPPVRYHIELEDLFYSTNVRYETRKRAPQPVDADEFAARRAANLAAQPAFVDALGPKLPGAYTDDESLRPAIPKLNQQYVALPRRLAMGELIVRVRAAAAANRDGRFPRMRVEAGITLGDGCSIDKRVLGEIDVAASLDKPQTYEFRMRLEDAPTKGPLRDEDSFDRLSVFDMDQLFISNVSGDSQAIFALGRGGYSDPATGSQRIAGQLKQMADAGVNFLHLDSVEIEMLPGRGADNQPYRWRVPARKEKQNAQQQLAAARELLSQFMSQAYRRPVSEKEIGDKLQLFEELRRRDYTFEESLRETLAAVLVSPSFLFLDLKSPKDATQPANAPTPHQLASRLSYLLWLSPPDKQLMQRADDGSLAAQSVLRNEADRLLADPRNRRFLESFCRQWLRLDKHENVAVDRQTYPTYDDDLGSDSLRETLEFFIHVFQSDRSAIELLDSDYAMLNDRLASHYDIDNVTAGNLHKVILPENSVRGGLLTQASLLTMNSDGVDSHPIRRGVWLLDRLLGDPPPPPPPNVPDLEKNDPDFRGLSLKERITLHRQPNECRDCHAKIDPWGIAFENFDATGQWRDHVDAAAVLPDGQPIDGIVELKQRLRRKHGEQFANALAHHMLTYALGRPPDYADRRHVQQIQQRFADSNYHLNELVLAIIESPLFRQ